MKQKLAFLFPAIIFLALLSGACSRTIPTAAVPPPPSSEVNPAEASPPPSSLETESPDQPEAEAPPDEKEEFDPQEEEHILDEQEASGLLEQALDAYQDARISWDRGDIEAALAALDEAYRILLKISISPDCPLQQEKDDMRLLIAQRIQEIYASRVTAVGGNHQTIPLVENKYVLQEIKRFQNQERKFFLESYERAGLYRDIILAELKQAGLPEELSWMPLIESGYKVTAYSRARALGLWQFISSTGYRFDLKRDRWVDERMDFLKATRAAVKYLEELHSFFGDWTTALAAYNCGEYRVQRVIKAQRINYLDNFWDLYTMLPSETSRYVPRFIATLLIINNPGKYGMTLPQPLPPIQFETIAVDNPVKLSSLASAAGIAASELETLNPELRYKSTPDYRYELRVPADSVERIQAAASGIPRWIPPEATYSIHYVRSGETVSEIARKHRTSIAAIAKLNKLGRRYLIRPGQRLKVPGSGYSEGGSSPPLPNLEKDGENMVYSVRRGDSLYRIASTFNTTVPQIKSTNKLQSDSLYVGQKLIIKSGVPQNASEYIVKAGDTPYEISKNFGMPLSTFLSINGLTSRSKIYPGQKVWIKK